MSAVNHPLPGGHLVHTVDKDRALALQLLDHKAVVHNLFADIDGRPEGFEGNADNIDGPHHARAKASRFQQQ